MARPARRRQAFLGRLAHLPVERTLAEIAKSLGFVFNTRKALGGALPEFGIGDYEGEPTTHRAVEVLRKELAAAVGRYEPRLAEVAVKLLGRHGYSMVRFEIAGVADGRPCALGVDVDTTTRHFEVYVDPEALREVDVDPEALR